MSAVGCARGAGGSIRPLHPSHNAIEAHAGQCTRACPKIAETARIEDLAVSAQSQLWFFFWTMPHGATHSVQSAPKNHFLAAWSPYSQ